MNDSSVGWFISNRLLDGGDINISRLRFLREYMTFCRKQNIEYLKLVLSAQVAASNQEKVQEILEMLRSLMLPSGESTKALMDQSDVLFREGSKVYSIQPKIRQENKDTLARELARIL